MKNSATGMIVPVVIGLAVGASGCAKTLQTRSTETSGFLRDYQQLQKGESGQALLLYANPAADLQKYTAIQMDPVRVYARPESELDKLPSADLQGLVDYLGATIRTELGGDYRLVEKAGSDVMRMRVAITEAKHSVVALDTLSSVLPPGIVISALQQLATGTPSAVGRARIEVELVDSITGKRLLAAVDERSGGKYGGELFKEWRDVKDAYDFWAKQMKVRLSELRAR